MDHLQVFLLGLIWSAAHEATAGCMVHQLAPARLSVSQQFVEVAGDLKWSWNPNKK